MVAQMINTVGLSNEVKKTSCTAPASPAEKMIPSRVIRFIAHQT